MAVRGHEKILNSLHAYLPDVSIFIGQYSVGRWKVAEHTRWYHGIHTDDTLRVHELTVDAVRTISDFTLTAPAAGPKKMVIVDLYRASAGSMVALTSVLESPGHAKIIVIARPTEALPGIRSRGVVFLFRSLSTDDVAAILMDKYSFGPDRARSLAERSGGQVVGALTLANAEPTLTLVRAAIMALRSHDADALNALVPKWTDEATGFLVQWCNEAVSQQWRVFDHEDYVEGRALPLKILIALRPRVRPRLVVRSQLMGVLKGE